MTVHRFTRRALVAALSAAPLPVLVRNVLPTEVEVLPPEEETPRERVERLARELTDALDEVAEDLGEESWTLGIFPPAEGCRSRCFASFWSADAEFQRWRLF